MGRFVDSITFIILAGGHIFALELNKFCWSSTISKRESYGNKEVMMWAKMWEPTAHKSPDVAFLTGFFFHLHSNVRQTALLTLKVPVCICLWVTGVNVKERGTSRPQFICLSSGITQLFSKHFYFGLNTWRERTQSPMNDTWLVMYLSYTKD